MIDQRCFEAPRHRIQLRAGEFRATQRFTLTHEALHIDTALQNLAAIPMPFGMGQHPYFPRPNGTRLRARVSAVWQGDPDRLPTERVPLPQEWNLGRGCLLDHTFIDHCFDGFGGEVMIRWPDGSGLIVAASAPAHFLVVYNPTPLAFFCVEPVTQLSDGFNMGARPGISALQAGLRSLKSGECTSVGHSYRYRADVGPLA